MMGNFESANVLAGRYEIEKVIGRGGTSVVYKAYDLQAERAVRAIKEISKTDTESYEMAKSESQLIRELYERDKSNAFFPNIIHRFEIGDKFYIVEDYLDGTTMDEVLKNGAMPRGLFLECAKQICSFMTFFHGTGRVHSDMKPDNIMVLGRSSTLMDEKSKNGAIKLKFIDFGTAVRNATGATGYTPEYAAPEQYREIMLDERTDVFNIGATFFHMIQGRKPMRVSSNMRMLTSAERFKFDKNVDASIKRIILKCVSDDPSKRYRSPEAIYRDLSRIENHSYLRIIIVSFVISVLAFGGSGYSAYMADTLRKQDSTYNYDRAIDANDYQTALKIDHTDRDDIYFNVIRSFIGNGSDEKLSMEENDFIINEIKSQDEMLRSGPHYGEIMNEIGCAYWLYYYPSSEEDIDDISLEKSRITASYEWFSRALEDTGFQMRDPAAYDRAEVYCSICAFYDEIDRKQREGTDDEALYNSLWMTLTDLREEIGDSNDIVSARVCQTLLSAISRFSGKFMQIGIEQSQQEEILDEITDRVYTKDGRVRYMNDHAADLAKRFDIAPVRLKVEMAYSG